MLYYSQLFWISGLLLLIVGTMVGATRLVTTADFSPDHQLRLIARHQVSFVFNAVYQMVALFKHRSIDAADLRCVRCYCVGGNKSPADVLAQMAAYFPNGELVNGIGMTEIGGLYAMAHLKQCPPASVGQLRHRVSVRVVDELGRPCGPNADGELCLRLGHMPLGYYGNAGETAQMFDADGFMFTGDVGHFDGNGNLYITGRKKELMKYCNYPITPAEIEAVLLRSPDIEAACAVGIPDAVAGELPAVAVVLRTGARLTEQHIGAMMADNLSDHYKLRGGVYFVDSLPLTASGKVMRRQTREQLIGLFHERRVVSG